MSTLQRYHVDALDASHELVVEVDLDVLTVERATEINTFLGGAKGRLAEESGDVVRVAVRLFSAMAIRLMLAGGGAEFREFGDSNPSQAAQWTRDVHEVEGMGGGNATPFGWCGIRIVAACVLLPGFSDILLEAVDT